MRWRAVVAALPVLERVPRLEEDVDTPALRPARTAKVGVAPDGTIEGAAASLVDLGAVRAGGAICEHVTKGGEKCHFPFKYKSAMYNKCTSKDSQGHGPWCFTNQKCQETECELKKEFWGQCICKGTTHEVGSIQWSYNSEGEDITFPNPDREPTTQRVYGQNEWGGSPGGERCNLAGVQSPVDIISNSVKVVNDEAKLHGQPCKTMVIRMDGYGVGVSYQSCEDRPKMTYKGKTYQMEKIVFKTPSEHTLDGRYFPIEAQLVHAEVGEDGIAKSYLVISVFNEVQIGNNRDNVFLKTFWERMTHLVPAIDVGDQVKIDSADGNPKHTNEKKREGYVYTEDPTCSGCSPFDDQFRGETCRVAAKPDEGSGEYEVECDRSQEGNPVRFKMPHGACNGQCNKHEQAFTWESVAEMKGEAATTIYDEYLPGDPKLPLHERGGFFFYEGTGTRPPCNATSFIIMREPVAVSKSQVDSLRTYFHANGGGKAPYNSVGALLMQPTGNGAAMAYTFDLTKGKTNRQIQPLNAEGGSGKRVITYCGPSLSGKGKAALAAIVFMFAYLV